MKSVSAWCLILLSLPSFAEVIKSELHSIEKVENNYLFKFENGRVAFLNKNEKSLVAHHLTALKHKSVEARVDENSSLLSMHPLENQVDETKSLETYEALEPPLYEPTIVPSFAEATQIFKRLNPNYKRSSECSNRAHVWANEEFNKNKLKSKKVFVLFTASYINRVRFKWWFHVAPMLTVKEGNKIEKRVMDFMFAHKPLTVQEWTNQFVFSQRACLPTTKFSEYDVNPQTEDCYLMESTMYDWSPKDLSIQERHGRFKTEFSQSEIKTAYSEAF